MRTILFGTALLCMFLVSGCASHHKQMAQQQPLTPMPEVKPLSDPSNQVFMQAINDYIIAKKAPRNTHFEFTRLDLNGDGRREGIVLLTSPHQYWCDMNGCSMAIFQARNDSFKLLSEVAPVRGPINVSNKTTNGWNDIVVTVSGRMDAEKKEVALKFEGNSYPSQPAFLPEARFAYNTVGGVRIFP